mmetsp:Transcript_96933/g.167202  ORF Transcript_96933/g.167202 Transcript_96933/m.167202 type:complete len:174 (-) Transcript_96933:1271-1792(-)
MDARGERCGWFYEKGHAGPWISGASGVHSDPAQQLDSVVQAVPLTVPLDLEATAAYTAALGTMPTCPPPWDVGCARLGACTGVRTWMRVRTGSGGDVCGGHHTGLRMRGMGRAGVPASGSGPGVGSADPEAVGGDAGACLARAMETVRGPVAPCAPGLGPLPSPGRHVVRAEP